ncbi:MAG TPA: hypothetical protein VI977_01910 [archaeon]|nr:hypothetical protein [archaeon]
MSKAGFELLEITQSWTGGGKQTETKNFSVREGESFDTHPKTKEPLFTLVKLTPEKVLVRYNREFTLKGYEQPASRETLLERGETKEFSHLWGSHGLTKKLTFSGITVE